MDPLGEQAVRTLLYAVVVAALVLVFLFSLHRDPRALRNGFLALVVGYVVLEFVGHLLSWSPALSFLGGAVSSGVVIAVILGLVLLPFALVGNGVLMLRRESRSIGNLLSLAAGLGMLALPLVAVILVRNENRITGTLLVVLLVAQLLAGFLFVGFLAHAVLYGFIARRVAATAVIVLGSGLVDDTVPPLLAARLRLAMVAATGRGTGGRPLPLVPSGGQGADESRPEGVAMGQWLQDNGVPGDAIIVEPRATTTEENLRYSVDLLEERGVPGPYLIATNNYHAPRAALLARSMGIGAHAIGAPTALYFLPSAFLREFVAVLSRRRITLALCALTVLASAAFVWPLLDS